MQSGSALYGGCAESSTFGRATDSVHHHAQLWGVGHTLSRGGQRNDAIRHAAVPCRCAHCLIARSPSKGF